MPPKPELLGIATLNEKGQIVIPSEARSKLKMNTGDKLLVFATPHQTLMLAKTEVIEEMNRVISKNIEDWRVQIEKVNDNKTIKNKRGH